MNARFLFAGSLTGRRLKAALGDLCEAIIWEEASATTSNQSSACPPADPRHIIKVVKYHKPDIVITFGAIATNGLLATMGNWQAIDSTSASMEFKVFACCHPAARKDANRQLWKLAQDVRHYVRLKEVAA